jgi:hypothetical protein
MRRAGNLQTIRQTGYSIAVRPLHGVDQLARSEQFRNLYSLVHPRPD